MCCGWSTREKARGSRGTMAKVRFVTRFSSSDVKNRALGVTQVCAAAAIVGHEGAR